MEFPNLLSNHMGWSSRGDAVAAFGATMAIGVIAANDSNMVNEGTIASFRWAKENYAEAERWAGVSETKVTSRVKWDLVNEWRSDPHQSLEGEACFGYGTTW